MKSILPALSVAVTVMPFTPMAREVTVAVHRPVAVTTGVPADAVVSVVIVRAAPISTVPLNASVDEAVTAGAGLMVSDGGIVSIVGVPPPLMP